MAVKKSTANQREDRTPAPKIPAVIAKPAAPATKSSGAAPKGGGQAASGSKLVQPTVTPKSSGSTKIPAPKTSTQIAADAQKILDQLGAMGQRLDTLYTEDNKLKDDTRDDIDTREDPSLVYAKMQDDQKAIADVIGKDISAVEFKDRVSTAVDRVKMADPATKSAFQQFYGIGEADLAKYFLDPSKSLVTLKEKATAAEIGGAAIGQGLPATAASAEDLAKFGISREQAQVGYSAIAEELPTATKLGQIYDEEGITYGQTEAEAATFKGLASAKRKKEQLKAREEAAFQGSSGVAPAGLKTTYLRQSSSAGYF